ncbi:MAG TPA: nicotinamide riboside transporter PnuC [Vicinamibacterales bacterium]|nr:nicotinamide riboside transporter PnuC [Vicinamibacterales bacterium]
MSGVEILGFVTGALSVWLAVRENVWNWPIAAANAVFFFVLFLRHRLYGDMALQVVFFGLAVLGWYRWLRGGEHHSALHVSRITARFSTTLAVVIVIATAAGTVYLRRIGDAAPFLDAATTVLSLAGQYLLTKKVIENWYIWIAADVLYIWMYLQGALYLTATLYVILLLMCIAGVLQWSRSLGGSVVSPGV